MRTCPSTVSVHRRVVGRAAYSQPDSRVSNPGRASAQTPRSQASCSAKGWSPAAQRRAGRELLVRPDSQAVATARAAQAMSCSPARWSGQGPKAAVEVNQDLRQVFRSSS